MTLAASAGSAGTRGTNGKNVRSISSKAVLLVGPRVTAYCSVRKGREDGGWKPRVYWGETAERGPGDPEQHSRVNETSKDSAFAVQEATPLYRQKG